MNICVYGASSDRIAPAYLQAGYELGKAIAAEGWTLVFGAGTTGVMGALVRGVQAENGKSIGVAPHFFNAMGVLHDTVDEMVLTDTMSQRKMKMAELADGFIMCPGGIGTYEEFFEVLTLRQLQQLNKPLCVLNTEGYYDLMVEMLRQAAAERFMDPAILDLFFVSSDVNELIAYLQNWKPVPVAVDMQLDIPYTPLENKNNGGKL